MGGVSLTFVLGVVLVVCVLVVVIRLVLRIDHSIAQRAKIIELLERIDAKQGG